ncbi:hypothetical protein [Rhizobium sp. GN54]|uniref:hypothetical protein n=1 Tax=Rhizobium sp. GN54 TaxID=2898150 RepID=UPI001E3C8786|nr:hypothetical protein [Rhizobium sp. GN54]MCD2185209.1 hypothetical protein [Rhizobium sp. GN54]
MSELSSHQLAALEDYIFGPNHVPAWEPKIGAWNPTIPTIFPTAKNPQRSVYARLPLMRQALMQFDVDPQVVSISAFPLSTEYWSTTSEGEPVKRTHVADVAILLRDTRVICIDYVPVGIQKDTPWHEAKTAQLEAHYEEEFGWPYVVHDERRVLAQPMAANASLLWRYMPCAADHAALPAVRRAVMGLVLPTTIAAITEGLASGHPEVTKLGMEASAFVFTAVMQLIIAGRLVVDLSLPITTASTVMKGASE